MVKYSFASTKYSIGIDARKRLMQFGIEKRILYHEKKNRDTFALPGTRFNCLAQKLPNKQEAGLQAPAGMTIDGKATAWGNQYQAYNKATQIFYSIANNATDLYLVIHADKSRIIEKIMEGGVSFTISTPGKKNSDKDAVILFPCLPIGECKSILASAGKKLSGSDVIMPNEEIYNVIKYPDYNKPNKDLKELSKVIKISGLAVPDTITGTGQLPQRKYYRQLPLKGHKFNYLPVVNKDGIQAATQFDSKGGYTYELRIPLKLLGITAGSDTKFNYNITLNARGEDNRNGNSWYYSKPPNQQMLNMDLENPTDLSGEYTLAKP